jgi:hypothetical protein
MGKKSSHFLYECRFFLESAGEIDVPGSDLAFMSENKPVADEEKGKEDRAGAKRARRWLRAAVFIAGSAAFGGLAVALWDRKILTAMRGKNGEPAPPQKYDEDI